MLKSVTTANAPSPAGHYAQAVIVDRFIFVSGQLPIDPNTGEKIITDIETQVRLALSNLEAVVIAAGSSKKHIAKITLFISDMALWGRANVVYAEFFGDHKPARSVAPIKELGQGVQVEIDAIAVLPE